MAVKAVSPGGWLFAEELLVDEAELKRITQVDDIYRLDRELDHLRALELIAAGFDFDTRVADITLSSLALQLYMRCKGRRDDPIAFYGLEPPETEQVETAGASIGEPKKPVRQRRAHKKATATKRRRK